MQNYIPETEIRKLISPLASSLVVLCLPLSLLSLQPVGLSVDNRNGSSGYDPKTIEGSVNIRDMGDNRIGGIVEDTITITSDITATNEVNTGPKISQRHILSDARCMEFDDFDRLNPSWAGLTETITDEYKIETASFVVIFQSVEFRDDLGEYSDVYCDDVLLEGMYASPTPEPTFTRRPTAPISATPTPETPPLILPLVSRNLDFGRIIFGSTTRELYIRSGPAIFGNTPYIDHHRIQKWQPGSDLEACSSGRYLRR